MSDGNSESVLKFWLEVVLGCPNWPKEKSLLLLLNTLCMAAFSRSNWSDSVQETLLEAYRVRKGVWFVGVAWGYTVGPPSFKAMGVLCYFLLHFRPWDQCSPRKA